MERYLAWQHLALHGLSGEVNFYREFPYSETDLEVL